MTISRSRVSVFVSSSQGAQPHGNLVIPFAAGRTAAEQAGFPVDDRAFLGHHIGIMTLAPGADVDLAQPQVGPGLMPVQREMLGGHRQGLQRPACRGRPEVERRLRTQERAQPRAHLIGLGETGPGQRGVEHVALHARCGVEHGLAMARDEKAADHRPRTQAMAAASIAVAAPRRA
jgi:hypothetical protein